MFLVSFLILRNGYLEDIITKQNERVEVEIIEWPRSRKSYFVKLKHKNKIFVKRTQAEYFRKYKENNEVIMLTNKEESKFIFPDEFKKNNNFLFGSLLSLISLIIIFKGIKIAGNKVSQE
tara:strand:+ start:263 stop:622 length:360 start_codon:yes stop_codon:yes gene_type:complete